MFLLVGLGSFIGGILRYTISLLLHHTADVNGRFPYATLAVNVVGSILIGIILGFSERGSISHEWRLFLATGICGGFTTFSAFSQECFTMLRSGLYAQSFTYITLSLVLGISACYFGFLLIKSYA